MRVAVDGVGTPILVELPRERAAELALQTGERVHVVPRQLTRLRAGILDLKRARATMDTHNVTKEAEPTPRPAPGAETPDALWASIRESLRGLRFGTVTLIVQDGVVIQIDRTEKRRLPRCA